MRNAARPHATRLQSGMIYLEPSPLRRGRTPLESFMAYSIIYSPEAVDHLAALPKATQELVLDQVGAAFARAGAADA